MTRQEAYEAYVRLLLERVREENYPSAEILDRLEAVLDRRHLGAYVELLLTKVARDRFPSRPLLDRIARLVTS